MEKENPIERVTVTKVTEPQAAIPVPIAAPAPVAGDAVLFPAGEGGAREDGAGVSALEVSTRATTEPPRADYIQRAGCEFRETLSGQDLSDTQTISYKWSRDGSCRVGVLNVLSIISVSVSLNRLVRILIIEIGSYPTAGLMRGRTPRSAAVVGRVGSLQTEGTVATNGLKFCSAATSPRAAAIALPLVPSCAMMESARVSSGRSRQYIVS